MPLEVRYDDFTTDTDENRLLHAATERLLRLTGLPKGPRVRLHRLAHRFADVSPLVPGAPLPRWRVTRLNARYEPALRLADVVLSGTSFEHATGDVPVSGFVIDMPGVFESFVTVALRRALAPYGGNVHAQHRTYLDDAALVPIRPDVVWLSDTGRPLLVLDAKYKAERPSGFPEADLYQALAYATALDLPEAHLVYAKGNDAHTSHTVRHAGTRLTAHALNLSQPPADLLQEVNDLAARLAAGTRAEAGRVHGDEVNRVRVSRWRRYGKDRLYVDGVDGERLGWFDLQTQVSHVVCAERAEAFTAAVTAWIGPVAAIVPDIATASDEAPDTTPVATGATDGESPPPERLADRDTETAPADSTGSVGDSEWDDLAEQTAGARARRQARAVRAEAPVRSALGRLLGVHTEERAWRIGADGERMVGGRLAKLERKDPRWRVLHSIPIGSEGSDIDHLVIGPGGVYTLNSKHHPDAAVWVSGDTVLINGQRHPYVPKSRHEAARASRLLSAACGLPVNAVGVVVPINARSLTIKHEPVGVHIVPRMALVDWLRRRPEALCESVIEAVFDAARRSTTWVPSEQSEK